MTPESLLMQTSSNGSFKSLEEVVAVTEYFMRYAQKQRENHQQHPQDPKSAAPFSPGMLWLQHLEVQFVAPEHIPEPRLYMAFGEATLNIQIPDLNYAPDIKNTLRSHYMERYFPLLSLSQIRMCTFLWNLLNEEERMNIRLSLGLRQAKGFEHSDPIL